MPPWHLHLTNKSGINTGSDRAAAHWKVKMFVHPADGSFSTPWLGAAVESYRPAGGAESHYLQNRSEVSSVFNMGTGCEAFWVISGSLGIAQGAGRTVLNSRAKPGIGHSFTLISVFQAVSCLLRALIWVLAAGLSILNKKWTQSYVYDGLFWEQKIIFARRSSQENNWRKQKYILYPYSSYKRSGWKQNSWAAIIFNFMLIIANTLIRWAHNYFLFAGTKLFCVWWWCPKKYKV